MIATQDPIALAAGPSVTSTFTWPASTGGYAAIQPYADVRCIVPSTPGVYSFSGSAKVELLISGAVVMEVTISGTLEVTVTASTSTATNTVTSAVWASGLVPSPDAPVGTAGRISTYGSNGLNGGSNFPTGATVAAGTQSFFIFAPYTLIYVPVGGVLRGTGISGTITNAGIFLSTKPKAAFTVSGTPALANVDGSTSQDSIREGPDTYIDDPNNSITAYQWNWGDGSSETNSVATASHEYSSAGTFTVTLTVFDAYVGRNSTSQSVTVTADTGRLVSFVVDNSGILVRAIAQTSPKALLTQRHYGITGSTWETVHTTATLQKAALGMPKQQSRVYRIAQRVTEKDWIVSYSDDLGQTWQESSPIAVPFDSTYKTVTRIAEAHGILLVLGLNASSTWVGKVSYDAGKTWATTAGTIGSASKSGDLEYSGGRFILIADNIAKVTLDTGATTWGNL